MTEKPFDPGEHLIDLKGKAYLPVQWRLVWLRSEHPEASITTELISITDTYAMFKATVTLPNGGSATGHGSEDKRDFNDFAEKAETKGIGRALAALGYGTQFAGELDESEHGRLVDSPVPRPKPADKPKRESTLNDSGKPLKPNGRAPAELRDAVIDVAKRLQKDRPWLEQWLQAEGYMIDGKVSRWADVLAAITAYATDQRITAEVTT